MMMWLDKQLIDELEKLEKNLKKIKKDYNILKTTSSKFKFGGIVAAACGIVAGFFSGGAGLSLILLGAGTGAQGGYLDFVYEEKNKKENKKIVSELRKCAEKHAQKSEETMQAIIDFKYIIEFCAKHKDLLGNYSRGELLTESILKAIFITAIIAGFSPILQEFIKECFSEDIGKETLFAIFKYGTNTEAITFIQKISDGINNLKSLEEMKSLKEMIREFKKSLYEEITELRRRIFGLNECH